LAGHLLLQIAGSESLDEGVRTLAAEFLVTLCEAREKAPGMMRKLPQVRCGRRAGWPWAAPFSPWGS
jgi:hypothetical protein